MAYARFIADVAYYWPDTVLSIETLRTRVSDERSEQQQLVR